MARRLEAERLPAVSIVRLIRQLVAAEKLVFFAREWITIAVADGLAAASGEIIDPFPAQALTLAKLAQHAASRLDATYPDVLRVSAQAAAWTQVAEVHRRTGSPELALPALDRADEALRSKPWLAHDRAIVDVARARTLHALGRDAQALAVLHAAAAVFAEYADRQRGAECAALVDSIQ